MKIGQMSFKKLSSNADYLQLDICGYTVEECIDRYKEYNTNIPIILHGDWTKRNKKGTSENNLEFRYKDYIRIINELKVITKVIGITIHPPSKRTMSVDKLIEICSIIKRETNVLVLVENRSNKSLNLSNPEEIIQFSKNNLMTIDIPQLYISCGYDFTKLIDTLTRIETKNVVEVHLANIKKSFVARKLNDGDLNIDYILKYLNKDAYYTLEILGGINIFNDMKEYLNEILLNKLKSNII